MLNANRIESDTVKLDSIKNFQAPQIISMGKTNPLDSALNKNIYIRPDFFATGMAGVIYNTPWLAKDLGYFYKIITPYPIKLKINSHTLEDFYQESFNLFYLPANFCQRVVLENDLGINSIDFITPVNEYTQPYSRLYFTLFGMNTMYSLDFTRAMNNKMGFYLSGLYSRQYKIRALGYLHTLSGYANFYSNQLIPARFDLLITNNEYTPQINSNFNDIALTGGNDFYKITFFRRYSAIEYLDTITRLITKNVFSTYSIDQKLLFKIIDIENTIRIRASVNGFQTNNQNASKNKLLEFYQKMNYSLKDFTIGLGYGLAYDIEKSIYFNPACKMSYRIIDSLDLFCGMNFYHNRANFIQKNGNGNFVYKDFNITGNPDIKDEAHLRKEIGLHFNKVMLKLYHTEVKNPIFYEQDRNNYYSAVNLDKGFISGIEWFFKIPSPRYISISGLGNYLIKNDVSPFFPHLNVKLCLGLQHKTERSQISIFTRLNYTGSRSDIFNNRHSPFWTISPGLSVKFITLQIDLLYDNMTDKRAGDLPNTLRNFIGEVKWEFWD